MLELHSSDHSSSSSQPQARPSSASNGVSAEHAERPGQPERDARDAERRQQQQGGAERQQQQGDAERRQQHGDAERQEQQQHGGDERRQLHRDVSLGIGRGGCRTPPCRADSCVDGGREEGSGEAVTLQGAAAALAQQQQGGDALAPGDGGRQGMTGRAVREWAQGAGKCEEEEDSAEGAHFPAPMLRVMPDLRPSSFSIATAATAVTAANPANAVTAAAAAASPQGATTTEQLPPPWPQAAVSAASPPLNLRAIGGRTTSLELPPSAGRPGLINVCVATEVAAATSRSVTRPQQPSRVASFTSKVAPEDTALGSPSHHHPPSRMASFTSKVASEDRPASPTHNRPSSRGGSFTSRVVSFTSRVASFTSRVAFEDAPASPTHRRPSSKASDGGSGSGSDGTRAAAAAEVKKHVPLKERLAKALSLNRHT